MTVCQARQTSADESPGSSDLLSFENAFSFLSISSVMFAVVAVGVPGLLLGLVLPDASTSSLSEPFLRGAGYTMILSAAVEGGLKDAAQRKELSDDNSRICMMACAVKSTGYLLAFFVAKPIWTPVLCAFYPSLAALSIGINLAGTAQYWPKQSNPTVGGIQPELLDGSTTTAPGGTGDMTSTMSTPATASSWLFSFCALRYLALAVSCYLPGDVSDPSLLLLQHTWAPGFILGGASCLVLKSDTSADSSGEKRAQLIQYGVVFMELLFLLDISLALSSGLASGVAGSALIIAGSLATIVSCATRRLQRA
eukprot:gene26094-11802_t